MKFGVHLSTFTKTWHEDYYPYFKDVKAFGYDGVEFPLMSPDDFDVLKAKTKLKEYGLLCTCGTGMNPHRDIASADKAINNNGVKHLKKCIDICHELESDCLGGVLYAPWGMCISRQEGRDNIQRSLENLSGIGDYAKEKGVYLALEMINRYESYFLNTVADGKDYLKRIDHNHIKLHLDTFHANIEEKSIKNALISGGNDIYHIHFCENDRGIVGTGSINWQQVREGLEAISYKRWITIENFVMGNCEVGKDVFIWRDIEDSGRVAAKEGITFMKTLFSK